MTTPHEPAAILRAAAKAMRERATAATPGPWQSSAGSREATVEQSAGEHTITDVAWCMDHPDAHAPDAAYIAGMHPLVALAVAGWLESVAYRDEDEDDSGPECADWNAALKVARAYLGESDA